MVKRDPKEIEEIKKRFLEHYPTAHTELHYKDLYQLLVAGEEGLLDVLRLPRLEAGAVHERGRPTAPAWGEDVVLGGLHRGRGRVGLRRRLHGIKADPTHRLNLG